MSGYAPADAPRVDPITDWPIYPMRVGNIDFLRVNAAQNGPVMVNVSHITRAQETGGELFICLTEGPAVRVKGTFQMLQAALSHLARMQK